MGTPFVGEIMYFRYMVCMHGPQSTVFLFFFFPEALGAALVLGRYSCPWVLAPLLGESMMCPVLNVCGGAGSVCRGGGAAPPPSRGLRGDDIDDRDLLPDTGPQSHRAQGRDFPFMGKP